MFFPYPFPKPLSMLVRSQPLPLAHRYLQKKMGRRRVLSRALAGTTEGNDWEGIFEVEVEGIILLAARQSLQPTENTCPLLPLNKNIRYKNYQPQARSQENHTIYVNEESHRGRRQHDDWDTTSARAQEARLWWAGVEERNRVVVAMER